MAQYLSLTISVLSFLGLIVLIIFRPKKRFFYLSMCFGFLIEIIFYIIVLGFGNRTFGNDNSSFLRAVQTILFGAWWIFEACSELYSKYRLHKVFKKVKFLKNLTKGSSSGYNKNG
jgi:hypothetical protein